MLVCLYAECHCVECRYAECRHVECLGAVEDLLIIEVLLKTFDEHRTYSKNVKLQKASLNVAFLLDTEISEKHKALFIST